MTPLRVTFTLAVLGVVAVVAAAVPSASKVSSLSTDGNAKNQLAAINGELAKISEEVALVNVQCRIDAAGHRQRYVGQRARVARLSTELADVSAQLQEAQVASERARHAAKEAAVRAEEVHSTCQQESTRARSEATPLRTDSAHIDGLVWSLDCFAEVQAAARPAKKTALLGERHLPSSVSVAVCAAAATAGAGTTARIAGSLLQLSSHPQRQANLVDRVTRLVWAQHEVAAGHDAHVHHEVAVTHVRNRRHRLRASRRLASLSRPDTAATAELAAHAAEALPATGCKVGRAECHPLLAALLAVRHELRVEAARVSGAADECQAKVEAAQREASTLVRLADNAQVRLFEGTARKSHVEGMRANDEAQAHNILASQREAAARCAETARNGESRRCALEMIRTRVLQGTGGLTTNSTNGVQDCDYSDWEVAPGSCEEICDVEHEKQPSLRATPLLLERRIVNPGGPGGLACREDLLQRTGTCQHRVPSDCRQGAAGPAPLDCVQEADADLAWEDWSKCSAECGGGVQHRVSRPPAECPHAKRMESRSCNSTGCDADCVLGEWRRTSTSPASYGSAAGSCSVSCRWGEWVSAALRTAGHRNLSNSPGSRRETRPLVRASRGQGACSAHRERWTSCDEGAEAVPDCPLLDASKAEQQASGGKGPRLPQVACAAGGSLFFVLDGSGFVNKDDFARQKRFVRAVLAQVSAAQVGLSAASGEGGRVAQVSAAAQSSTASLAQVPMTAFDHVGEDGAKQGAEQAGRLTEALGKQRFGGLFAGAALEAAAVALRRGLPFDDAQESGEVAGDPDAAEAPTVVLTLLDGIDKVADSEALVAQARALRKSGARVMVLARRRLPDGGRSQCEVASAPCRDNVVFVPSAGASAAQADGDWSDAAVEVVRRSCRALSMSASEPGTADAADDADVVSLLER